MKLNLGCNTRAKAGYVNIDKDKYPGVDVICDVFKLDMADGVADEVYVSHILEHASHTRTVDILKEWHRVLRKGGVLKIAVPDFDRAIELYLKCGLGDWVVNYLWGDQGYDGANHYCGFNEARLTAKLKEAGFRDISRVERLPGSSDTECSNNVSNVDMRPVSLNMVAIK